MQEGIYLDNAATSFPKAPGVGRAMARFIEEVGSNVARGGYASAYAAAERVWETREQLCRLLGFGRPRNVIFTANITQSLNMLLKGLLRPGDHVLVSSVEHNAMMRPLTQLAKGGVTFSRIPCDTTGRLRLEAVEPLIGPRTRAIFITHASNVSGAVMPIAELGRIARRRGIFLVLDAAQTAGCFEIDMARDGIDALAFTGHKGLLGPQGIGGFILSDALAGLLDPLISGGTGSASDSEEVPASLPDRFEAGTPNLPGIYGLHAALKYLEGVGADAIRAREIALAQRLEAGLAALPGLRLLGPSDWSGRVAVVSVDCLGRDNALVADALSTDFGVMTRCGLHCAPAAHRTLGTFPQGAVRFSPGHLNTEADVDAAIAAMAQILGASL